jgi:hypothetical protein
MFDGTLIITHSRIFSASKIFNRHVGYAISFSGIHICVFWYCLDWILQHLDTFVCEPLPKRSTNQQLRVSSLQQVLFSADSTHISCNSVYQIIFFSLKLSLTDYIIHCRELGCWSWSLWNCIWVIWMSLFIEIAAVGSSLACFWGNLLVGKRGCRPTLCQLGWPWIPLTTISTKSKWVSYVWLTICCIL